ncbi:MbnP family copper-binding protein [Myxococcus sp. Y35]|uniref:MbnP family copper-binding protein n=1 Tax=Pseudomyxococcus flavus TaxID=3115648 RepID=UPI003CEEA020
MVSARRCAVRSLPFVMLGALGCGDEPRLEVAIPFEARIGSEPYACGRTYTGVGTTGTTYEPMDFRVYVHDVRLVTADGDEVALDLTEDERWQSQGTALLDFADKSGQCTQGTDATNLRIIGTAPEGEYAGLRFKLGVPETLNHLDVSTAPAPLNDTSLYWSWRSGYLFTRIEGRTTGLSEGHVMHLGSTDCAPPPEGQTQGTAGCTFGNRPEVALDTFNLASGKVVLDLGALFAGSNLDVNAEVPNTSVGCMSQQTDPDCAPLFSRMGLTHRSQEGAPGPQSFIKAE